MKCLNIGDDFNIGLRVFFGAEYVNKGGVAPDLNRLKNGEEIKCISINKSVATPSVEKASTENEFLPTFHWMDYMVRTGDFLEKGERDKDIIYGNVIRFQ